MLSNSEIEKHFQKLSAHSDVADLFRASLKKLGEYELRGGSAGYSALYAVTKGLVFCAAAGMHATYWRLRPSDVAIAMSTGAKSTDIGPEWVMIAVFEANWPTPDLAHWALRAYDFARSGK